MSEDLSKKDQIQKWLYRIAIFLLFPALLINLGLIAFIDDEGIRSIVALEMKISGNYIAPTLFGEYYYNKPPLYNWILLAFFELSGVINEWSARIPTLLFLLLYASTVFYYFRKHFSTKIAFLNAFALITCGRILFWDSMLGLIDICFSWVIFLMFMIIYHAFQKKEFYKLFGWAYFLTALAFLLKGLPALVFLGTTLLTLFIFQRQFKKLFSLPHLFGGLIFFTILSGYYLAYDQYNSLENIFTTLFNESSKRTFVKYGWTETILHLFTFPFEMTYHFFPWSIFIIYFFTKPQNLKGVFNKGFNSKLDRWGTFQLIRKNEFLTYNLLIFFTTILVYWTSVEVYPRYLLMHAPLIFSAFFFLHYENKKEQTPLFNFFDRLFFIFCIFATLASIIPIFLPETQDFNYLYIKVLGLFLALGALTYLYQKLKTERLVILVLVLLVIRIGFNWFVLPNRLIIEWSTQMRESSIEVGQKFKPLYSYKSSVGLQPANGFYLTRETGNILESHYEKFDTSAYYLIHENFRFHVNFKQYGKFKMMNKNLYYIGKIKRD
ncbi:MAG: glycosyltransferase family 39 protein [Saprospiraceae bacterium]|jgi:4-amino-4-deoxy-L-arabinose transferase-like glycosyltransferase|nr:glycosyltransferase family 39 protein [Saprospiraceae bacterium]